MDQICNVVKDLLPLYADGLLSEETRRFVEQHLDSCEGCKRFFEKYFVKLQRVEAGQPLKEELKKVVEPFKKLRKMTKKKVILSIVITIAVIFCGFWGYVLGEAAISDDWTGMDCILSIDQEKVIQNDRYTEQLRDLIAEKEGWDPDAIIFRSIMPGLNFSVGRSEGNKWTFLRGLEYQGKDYYCYFFAHEYFAGCFRITGYEFGQLGEDGKTIYYSEGSGSYEALP